MTILLGLRGSIPRQSMAGPPFSRQANLTTIQSGATIPVVTLFFVNFTALISGAVVTETIFAWPGVGRLLVDSLLLRDYPTTQTVIFFAAACIVCINIVVDMLYAWLDPRIRVAS